MMCSRRSKSLDEEERGVGLGNCPWGTGGSCVSGGAVSGILIVENLTLPVARARARAARVQREWKNALILLVIRGVDAGDDRS